VAVATHPSARIALAYLGGYFALRAAMMWLIGVHVMKQPGLWKKMPLIPVWDLMAFGIWLASFGRRTIRWRGVDYFIREGRLVAAAPNTAPNASQ